MRRMLRPLSRSKQCLPSHTNQYGYVKEHDRTRRSVNQSASVNWHIAL